MKILDVGCGTDKIQGAIGLDRVKLEGVDVVHDLNNFPWPFEDESFDEIYMLDVIEHIDNTIKAMEEVHRLLKNGGKLFIRVIYWNHKYAFSDPTHVTFFSEITWEFFTGKRRSYYTKALFKMEKFEYTYDALAMKIFKSKRLVHFLSNFLCNMIDGMRLTLVK
jgi:ubiquinone/menaquinone biosynthesis C-methylase UbiE